VGRGAQNQIRRGCFALTELLLPVPRALIRGMDLRQGLPWKLHLYARHITADGEMHQDAPAQDG